MKTPHNSILVYALAYVVFIFLGGIIASNFFYGTFWGTPGFLLAWFLALMAGLLPLAVVFTLLHISHPPLEQNFKKHFHKKGD
jgi:hypothetical protein